MLVGKIHNIFIKIVREDNLDCNRMQQHKKQFRNDIDELLLLFKLFSLQKLIQLKNKTNLNNSLK